MGPAVMSSSLKKGHCANVGTFNYSGDYLTFELRLFLRVMEVKWQPFEKLIFNHIFVDIGQ